MLPIAQYGTFLKAFVDRRTLTRGGGAGDLEVRYTIPAGSSAWLQNGEVQNSDDVARTVNSRYTDGDANNSLFFLVNASVNAGARTNLISNTASAQIPPNAPLPMFSGHMLRATLVAAAATKAGTFAALFLVPDGAANPTVTEVNV